MENKMKNVLPLKSIIKNITVEKWLLIGGAGIMLILCSDSCGGKGADKKEEIATEIDDNTGTMSLDSEKYDLAKDSVVLLEQLRTIDKKRLKDKVCHLDDQVMQKVNMALKISLELDT